MVKTFKDHKLTSDA